MKSRNERFYGFFVTSLEFRSVQPIAASPSRKNAVPNQNVLSCFAEPRKSNRLTRFSYATDDALRVQRTRHIPEILNAVGLCAVESPPKCYAKKKITLTDTRYETKCKIVYITSADFGQIDWETAHSEMSLY